VRFTGVVAAISLAAVATCGAPTGEGWPIGYAALEGTIQVNGSPYSGGLVVEFGGHVDTFNTSVPGAYQFEIAAAFPEGVPDSSMALHLRPLSGSAFHESTRVRFGTSPRTRPLVRLDIRTP
jgi:hypothetical protein